jgi:hypothetical protein
METGGLQEKVRSSDGGGEKSREDLRKHVTLTGRILIGNLISVILQTQSMKGVKYADIEGIQD